MPTVINETQNVQMALKKDGCKYNHKKIQAFDLTLMI